MPVMLELESISAVFSEQFVRIWFVFVIFVASFLINLEYEIWTKDKKIKEADIFFCPHGYRLFLL